MLVAEASQPNTSLDPLLSPVTFHLDISLRLTISHEVHRPAGPEARQQVRPDPMLLDNVQDIVYSKNGHDIVYSL